MNSRLESHYLILFSKQTQNKGTCPVTVTLAQIASMIFPPPDLEAKRVGHAKRSCIDYPQPVKVVNNLKLRRKPRGVQIKKKIARNQRIFASRNSNILETALHK